MEILEAYERLLEEEAARRRAAAEAARAQGDKRTQSTELMRASMLGPMLRQLGKVEHEKIRPGILQREIDFLSGEEKRFLALGDYDLADRSRIKAETVRFALEALRRLEAEA